MKKLIKWAAAGAAAALLFGSASFAQSGTTTITVEKASPTQVQVVQSSGQSGYKVCYMPTPRHVQGSRLVQRCGPYGCQNFRITRDFDVKVYEDCHIEKYSCSRGYVNFGWYPNKSQARDAVSRCQRTISGNVPEEWKINY